MGSCHSEKLAEYKHKYPMSNKLDSEDPRLNDPNFLRQEIDKLDYIIKYQNKDLAKLDDENQKLRKKPRNRKKVLNNAKKLYIMTKNGYICKQCMIDHDTNLLSPEQLVKVEGLCGKCKGDGTKRQIIRVKSKQCGICNRFQEYLWKLELCKDCEGVGMLQTHRTSLYAMEPVKENDRVVGSNPYETLEPVKKY